MIGGWRTEGARFRSLIGGVWDSGRLRYVGRWLFRRDDPGADAAP